MVVNWPAQSPTPGPKPTASTASHRLANSVREQYMTSGYRVLSDVSPLGGIQAVVSPAPLYRLAPLASSAAPIRVSLPAIMRAWPYVPLCENGLRDRYIR